MRIPCSAATEPMPYAPPKKRRLPHEFSWYARKTGSAADGGQIALRQAMVGGSGAIAGQTITADAAVALLLLLLLPLPDAC